MGPNTDLPRIARNDDGTACEVEQQIDAQSDGVPTIAEPADELSVFGGLFGGTFGFDHQHAPDKTHGQPEEEH
jgi:hypothetical protein